MGKYQLQWLSTAHHCEATLRRLNREKTMASSGSSGSSSSNDSSRDSSGPGPQQQQQQQHQRSTNKSMLQAAVQVLCC